MPDFSEFQHCYHWTQQTTAALWIFVSLVYGPRQSQDHHCHLRQRNPRKLQNQLVDLPFFKPNFQNYITLILITQNSISQNQIFLMTIRWNAFKTRNYLIERHLSRSPNYTYMVMNCTNSNGSYFMIFKKMYLQKITIIQYDRYTYMIFNMTQNRF